MASKRIRYLPLYRGPLDMGIPGSFGYRAPFACLHCGPIHRVEIIQTYRQTMESPAEHEWCCPICGSLDTGENDDPKPFKPVGRWRMRLARIGHH